MIKRNIYKWHRVCSLIIAVPVIVWAVSGFMHPIMTTIRPRIATQAINSIPIDTSKVTVPLRLALQRNKIDSLQAVRMVHIEDNWFYQIKVPHRMELQYISTRDGKVLRNGDRLYAQYIARIFLEGEGRSDASTLPYVSQDTDDCCNAATVCVLNPKKGARVKDVSVITSFDGSYQSINRILPVYKVSFKREDGVSIYVETAQDRFVFATNRWRVAFATFFRIAHTWSWADFLGKGKLLLEMALTALAFMTTLMGIYIFFATKPVKGNSPAAAARPRRYHRYTAIGVSLFTLMFTFSGCYHALSKFSSQAADPVVSYTFSAAHADLDVVKLQRALRRGVYTIGLTKINDRLYWQAYCVVPDKTRTKDVMKEMGMAAPSVAYLDAGDYSLLKDGSEKHAVYLATRFTGLRETDIQSVSLVARFDHEYNFADKLLPVWRVAYVTANNDRCFVETATGRLAKRMDDNAGYERYSFSFLHKHEFLGAFGKGVKDFSTMFWSAAQVAMVVIGLLLWAKSRSLRK